MEHSADDIIDLLLEKNTSKESNQVSNLVSVLFGSPKIFLEKLSLTKKESSCQNQSGFDLKIIFKMYETVSLMGLDGQISVHINKVCNQLVGESELKEFLKSAQDIKYFFVVLLWRKLYSDIANRQILLRILSLVKRAEYYKAILISCLCDVEQGHFRFMVQNINLILSEIVTRYLEEPSEETHKQFAPQVELVCNILSILYQSNKTNRRLTLEQFNNKVIMEEIDPLGQYKLVLNKINDFNFVNYPFLLGFDYKYKIIQLESIYEQKMNIRKNMESGFSNILQQVDFNHQFSLDGLIFLYFNVNRSNILDDSMEKLGKIKQNLKSPMKISFIGQEGADQGGVKNEYFQLVTKAIFNPYLDMFLSKNQGRLYWFNPHSFEPPIRFQFVGMLLGLALYNSVHLDIHFPDLIYKKLLTKDYEDEPSMETVEDLVQIDPETYKTLKHILTTSDDVDNLELYFVIELESFGEKFLEELVEDGSSIKVSNDNRQFYCLLYADYLINKSIHQQYTAFKKGFNRVVSGGIIETFEPEELRVLIGGIEEIDLKQLQDTTQYEGGYTKQTPVVRNFWELLHTLSKEERKSFLFFVTGTDRVPIDGLKSLNFLIQKHADSTKLPTAHTCFNVLLLPDYETKQKLDRNLRIILEHNQGFGLI